jgi:ATP-binding cassette subfamily C protein CydC
VKPLAFILALWRPYRTRLVLGLLIAWLAAVSGMWLLGAAGGRVALGMGGAPLAAGLSLRFLGAARLILRYLERLATHDATFRALAGLRVWFFTRFAAGAAAGLGLRRGAAVLSRLVDDIDRLDGLYLRILVPLVATLGLAPLLLFLLARAGWESALAVGVLFVLTALALPLVTALRARRHAAARAAALERLRVVLTDITSGLREIRAFGAEEWMGERLARAWQEVGDAERARAGLLAGLGAVSFLAAQAALIAVIGWSAALGKAAVPLALMTLAVFELAVPLARIGREVGEAAVAAERVIAYAETPPRVPDPAQPSPPPVRTTLVFEGVTAGWEEERMVLRDFDLTIPEGAHVAVLGPSGAGKSTLAALALKVIAPRAGRLTLGGVDYAALKAADVHGRIAWLGQTSHLFADTIRNNLLIGRPDADEAALWAALEAARLADVVRSLPDRLDTWIGEGGSGLSGGQGRRLALARALLSPAPLLILDEPCAGLDADTEREFFAALAAAAAGRGVLLLAHRLTGAERLDRIFRLTDGRALPAAG